MRVGSVIGCGASGVECGVGRKAWGGCRGGVAGLGRVVGTLCVQLGSVSGVLSSHDPVQLLSVIATFDLQCMLDMTAHVRRT